MPQVRFAKYEGLANDFIIVDGPTHWMTAEAAARVCDRRRGIGADGVLTLLPPRHPDASIRMHVFNADGSVAEMCGNGLRCVIRHVLGGAAVDRLIVDTDGGVRSGWLREDGLVRVTMGEAALIANRVEAVAPDVIYSGMALSLGNPHLVLDAFPPGTDLTKLARKYGPVFERHPMFPERVNVSFLSVEEDHIRLVVYERGSGITQACGTGACAAAVAARRLGVVRPGQIRVQLPGGPLYVEIEGEPTAGADAGAILGSVMALGDANHVFDGEVELASHELQ